LQQFVLLRSDAGKARDLRKQRIEQSGAHRGSLWSFSLVMPGFGPGFHAFFDDPGLPRRDGGLTFAIDLAI
jgi:hypothetical protein